jgi:phage terminase small subunit
VTPPRRPVPQFPQIPQLGGGLLPTRRPDEDRPPQVQTPRESSGLLWSVPTPELSQTPEPPGHLSAASAGWWRQVVRAYDLDPHHLLLLTAAAEELDTATQARRVVEREGPSVVDRYGQPRPHPMLEQARKSRQAFRLLVRELGLDVTTGANAEPRISPRPGGR